jgi:hypothetical protein
MRRNWCRQAFIFTGTDDPSVASFDVVLGKGGSGSGNALVHVHPLAEERFLVTSGRIKVVFDGRPQRADGDYAPMTFGTNTRKQVFRIMQLCDLRLGESQLNRKQCPLLAQHVEECKRTTAHARARTTTCQLRRSVRSIRKHREGPGSRMRQH